MATGSGPGNALVFLAPGVGRALRGNGLAIATALFAASAFAHAEVIISEFVAENDGHLLDVDGESSDWIELHNNGGAPVNLAGWFLTDDSQQPFLWPFLDHLGRDKGRQFTFFLDEILA